MTSDLSINPILFWRELMKLAVSSDNPLERKAALTINAPIYPAITLAQTDSPILSRTTYDLVLLEASRVILLDKYHETEKREFLEEADAYRERLLERLNPDFRSKLLRLEDSLLPFFDLEKSIARRMNQGIEINERELSKYTSRKSSDVLLYVLLTESVCGRISKRVVRRLYREQMLRDLDDDVSDMNEDLLEGGTNTILARMPNNLFINQRNPLKQEELVRVAHSMGVVEEQRRLIDKLDPRGTLPDEYQWLEGCVIER